MGDRRNDQEHGGSNDLMPSMLGRPLPSDLAEYAFTDPSLARGNAEAKHSYDDARARRLLVKTLALLRKALGMSQTELAQRMNTSQSAISEIEKGIKDPRLSTLQRMARSLNAELQVGVSAGSWFLWLWDHRDIAYGSSVHPTRVEEGFEDLWITMLNDRDDRGTRLSVSSEESNMKPLMSRDPRDDNYLTGTDLLDMSISRSTMLQEKT